ncbi:Glu/Leu/Phe/Val dehydrogenase dimerization domain-containing protein [Mycolicibacterium porcinum]|uniref:Glu/Leu/Phe/Val dehydrogenase dimerization domain-containing protein n=1 Tax=Mycolicibacterium porcinum TaxID=39693 RepID=UPI000ADBB552|nr:Glu/Leu/Phe/Val dehydrogenase dimerization domain-containing protein [Mycolicibacterium porcinum]
MTAVHTASGVFGRSQELSSRAHEQVVFCEDAKSGLKAIIAIHSTALGPALGGTRMYPYADEFEALEDVLRLSWGMSYKAAAAGVDLGGGKAVIIGDPATDKSEELFAAYARFVNGLGGRYVTAGDVGTNTDDLDVIGKYTRHVTGRSIAAGGSGDSARLTALGVFNAMRAGAESVWGTASLAGRTVGVEGVGKVGSELIALLLADGAEVCATDVNEAALPKGLDFGNDSPTGGVAHLQYQMWTARTGCLPCGTDRQPPHPGRPPIRVDGRYYVRATRKPIERSRTRVSLAMESR